MSYKSFYAAFKQSQQQGNNMSKEELIASYTNGRTTSLKELSPKELAHITQNLNGLNLNPKSDKMRKSIIAIFKKVGYSTQQAIDWAEGQGVKGVKKKFNDYTNAELFVLIRVAEKINSDKQKSIRKKIADSEF